MRYSSLCDYETLILFKFSKDYNEIYMTMPNQKNFRKSLLGLLHMAYNEDD